MRGMRFESLCLHAGHQPDPITLSRGVPVHRTSSYVFKSAEHAQNLFALKELGNIYTRLMNPTHDVLEQRVAALEGGAAAVAVASGTSACHYAVINCCSAGDDIVSANDLYGGTYTMFDAIHPQLGIGTQWVDARDPENVRRAIGPRTRAVFVESASNPALHVPDLQAIADIAHANGLPLIVDNTFCTPYLCRPIEHGADVVVHSLTKWIGGHGVAIGGILVDSGRFPWGTPRHPLFDEPDRSYHGLRFGHDLGPLAPICFAMRARVVPLRNLGACISPDNAWMFLQGLETLPLRMERHCQNAADVAGFLRQHPRVAWVRYPGLSDDPAHPIATRQMATPDGRNLYGSMVVFGIHGGRDAGRRFIEQLRLFSHLANVGDAKSLAIHPASTTHSQLSDAGLAGAGISPELVRLSIGIEHIDDIVADLDHALQAAG